MSRWLAAALLFASIYFLHAAPPSLEGFYPAGAGRGSTNTIQALGNMDPWPPKVWINSEDVTFASTTNKGRFEVVVAPNAQAGPRLVRLFNEEGASETRIFVVGSDTELTEAETNNHYAQAQLMHKLPVTINGRLSKGGDVDSFAVTVRSNEWLEAQVDSHTIMSKLDAVLRLVTTNGQQLVWNHDRVTLDPSLRWRAPSNQTVVMQVFGFPFPATSDVRLYGGDQAFYRLHLSGRMVPESKLEQGRQHPLPLPFNVRGAIANGDEQDRFSFELSKDDFIELRVSAAGSGSPLDAWLTFSDSSGREIDRKDDAEASLDPVLEWKASSNGTYTATIGSLTHRGGEDFVYELSGRIVGPEFRATLASSSIALRPGATNTIKFNLKRLRGHTNELVAAITDLPDTVTILSTNVPSGGGEGTVQIVANTNATPFNGPIEVSLIDLVSNEKRLVPLMLVSRTEDNGVPGGYSQLLTDRVDHVWLTIRAQEKPKEITKK